MSSESTGITPPDQVERAVRLTCSIIWSTASRSVVSGMAVPWVFLAICMIRAASTHWRSAARGEPRGPLTGSGIYQVIARRGVQAGVAVHPHRFRHHFSHTWLDRGGPEGDLMELCGWTSPQMLRVYGASARSARARRSYDRIMDGTA
jgi:integrase